MVSQKKVKSDVKIYQGFAFKKKEENRSGCEKAVTSTLSHREKASSDVPW